MALITRLNFLTVLPSGVCDMIKWEEPNYAMMSYIICIFSSKIIIMRMYESLVLVLAEMSDGPKRSFSRSYNKDCYYAVSHVR
jgi:hypothetical protein